MEAFWLCKGYVFTDYQIQTLVFRIVCRIERAMKLRSGTSFIISARFIVGRQRRFGFRGTEQTLNSVYECSY